MPEMWRVERTKEERERWRAAYHVSMRACSSGTDGIISCVLSLLSGTVSLRNAIGPDLQSWDIKRAFAFSWSTVRHRRYARVSSGHRASRREGRKVLRSRYLAISIVRLGRAGEKSCFSSSHVSQQLSHDGALLLLPAWHTMCKRRRSRRIVSILPDKVD